MGIKYREDLDRVISIPADNDALQRAQIAIMDIAHSQLTLKSAELAIRKEYKLEAFDTIDLDKGAIEKFDPSSMEPAPSGASKPAPAFPDAEPTGTAPPEHEVLADMQAALADQQAADREAETDEPWDEAPGAPQ
jgi:hypothetical protein